MAFSSNSGISRQRAQQELTRWDLFLCVAGRPEGIALTRLAHVLHVERERSLIRPLGSLADDELIIDEGNDRYTVSTSKRAQLLRTTPLLRPSLRLRLQLLLRAVHG